jgi:nitroreductase
MTERTADPRVVPLIVERWSPRAFDESALPAEDLAVILEAATLAPSAYNYQPWRFLHSTKGDANWDRFLSLLIPFNASWAKDAGALVFIVSDTLMRSPDAANPNHSHSFDAGAAWALLALQATALGYHAHGMTGLDFAKAKEELGIPDDFRLEAAVAIGRKDSPNACPKAFAVAKCPAPTARSRKSRLPVSLPIWLETPDFFKTERGMGAYPSPFLFPRRQDLFLPFVRCKARFVASAASLTRPMISRNDIAPSTVMPPTGSARPAGRRETAERSINYGVSHDEFRQAPVPRRHCRNRSHRTPSTQRAGRDRAWCRHLASVEHAST